MPYSKTHNFIFIHIPKCAGKSLTKALETAGIGLDFKGRTDSTHLNLYQIKDLWLHHISANEFRRILPPEIFNHSFKFTVVRNPWDLLVSYYHYHKNEYRYSQSFRIEWPNIAKKFEAQCTFEEWLDSGVYVQPHLNFLRDEQGTILVDYIAKFECLRNDFKTICKKIGINVELPHINKTEHQPYKLYYNNHTKRIVENAFKEDIEYFKYKF